MTGQTEPRLVDPAPFVPTQSGPAADADGQAETTTAAGSLLAGRYRLGSPGRFGCRRGSGVLARRRHRAAPGRRRHRAAPLRPGHGPGRRRGSRPRPGDHRASAAVRQLRAPRLRAAAGRARTRRSGPARRGAGGGRRRVGPRPEPGRSRRGRDAQTARRGQGPAAAGGRRRGGAPPRPRAGLRPSAAAPAQPRRSPAARLRTATPGADAGRRRAWPRCRALHAAHGALAALALGRRPRGTPAC